MIIQEEEDFTVNAKDQREHAGPHNIDVTLPPFPPKSSNDVRNNIRSTLRLFHSLCRKLLQHEEAKTTDPRESLSPKRIDLAALKIIKENTREQNPRKNTFGPVPGVEIGDEFQYRTELALVGVHWVFEEDIDYIKHEKHTFAVSVVFAGHDYDHEFDGPDRFIYSGHQKLESEILALKNNILHKHPVRVVRGYKDPKYVYDGLYSVDRCWQEPVPLGNFFFKFELKKIPGQAEKNSKKVKICEGVCVNDITGGNEAFRIRAVNTVDHEKPPPFNYITKMLYPDWYRCRSVPPEGCSCVRRCSPTSCACVLKNSCEFPYNHNGAIVEPKPLLYECGPSCKCPPTCYNRVTQHGIKIQLEIFKTGSRGWGVRSLSSVSSGSFVCGYIGELLEDSEAEKRSGNDEYLFDIGNMGGFTIDAASYGNVGRFINHSCSPNLYAQNVVYDVEDERAPHIMFFAAENIPPLEELTYHYNYDSDGNMTVKSCYCGSSECTGRLY